MTRKRACGLSASATWRIAKRREKMQCRPERPMTLITVSAAVATEGCTVIALCTTSRCLEVLSDFQAETAI